LFGLIVSLGLAGQGWAADNPLPLVGRVSAAAGAVQYHATEGAWSNALVNEPVAVGTGLHTGPGAAAEFHWPGARVALAPATELQLLHGDRDTLQVAVSVGRIGIHLDDNAAKTVEIDLPGGGVWLNAPGEYDVYAGDARIAAAVQVFAGKARFGGGLDDRYLMTAAPDWFSDWWRSQGDTADLTDPRPWPDIAGIAALGDAGRWELDPVFGNVWYPSGIAADWAPYRDGEWRFLAPWGWTWVDNEPWGFAPSHYGRWARIEGHWGWVPGEQLTAGDYSPGVVAFLGTAGIGLSRAGDIGAMPAVAWFPLAPDEVLGDADGAYKNRRFATAVPRNAFAAGLRSISALITDIPAQRFADAPVILGALGIAPPGANVPPTAPKKVEPGPNRIDVVMAPDSPADGFAPVASAERRQPFIVALRDAPVRAPAPEIRKSRNTPVRGPAPEIRKRVRVAVELRARGSTSATRAAHTRQHLAAARRRA
jgi:hypothetical protein